MPNKHEEFEEILSACWQIASYVHLAYGMLKLQVKGTKQNEMVDGSLSFPPEVNL